jgi:hypothetical protein
MNVERAAAQHCARNADNGVLHIKQEFTETHSAGGNERQQRFPVPSNGKTAAADTLACGQ